VLRGLERHSLFFSAALPKQISPPLFNRYGGEANRFGNHVDSAVRYLRDARAGSAPTSRAPCSCRSPTSTTAAS
jgi:predicted 2-oxoglutarate/Fe(II)-dependent dioxygenase YbiX